MTNLFDIAKAAQGGMGLQNLSRDFGLDPDQARRAVEALLPAFTLAFRKMAFDPMAFAGLAGAVGSGRYAPYFDAHPAGSPLGNAAPAGVMMQVFGSPQVAGQVAAQAAAMSGIGAQVLLQMLPTLAAMLVGGMSRYASVEGFADFLRQWSDALRAAQPQKPEPAAFDPWSAWAGIVGASLGAAPQRPAVPPARNPFEAWSDLMSAMLGGSAPKPPPAPNPAKGLADMFESGLEVQAQYLRALQAVFGQAQDKPAT